MPGYEMDELMPVVAELTRKYTSGESSSVTYETARHLMEAVLYCIGELESGNLPVGEGALSAGQAYRLGCERVREKVRAAEQTYKELLSHFSAYENENYYDTVVKGIAGFFTCYDVRFSPQETIITMDYPVLASLNGKTGIDAVSEYIRCIALEQRFLGAFQAGFVTDILTRFHPGYRRQFFNLCRVVFRHVVAKTLVIDRQRQGERAEAEEILENAADRLPAPELTELLERAADAVIERGWEMPPELGGYLKRDIPDFVTELRMAAQNHCVPKIVVV